MQVQRNIYFLTFLLLLEMRNDLSFRIEIEIKHMKEELRGDWRYESMT